VVSASREEPIELSFVIPVYNGAATIARVVERIHELYGDLRFEVVLVNDGSQDDSERVCADLVRRYRATVVFLHLARNFGEHGAVLAGLNHARGRHVATLDDDGQNPPEEVRRLYDAIRSTGRDVMYGRYRVKHHGLLRNLGSRFNDHVANLMLSKPRELYLSSFRVLDRFVVDEVVRY
jgi:undecaprenyl-phosphate 4-deoxy-4-formamido-L-arabinose transferase